MFSPKLVFRRPLTQLLAFLMCTALAVRTVAADPAPLSENVTDNLINRLVERGVITKQDADELLKQAEDDAANARGQAIAAKQVAAAKEAAAIQVAAADEIAAKQVAAAKEIAEIQLATAREIAAIQAAAKPQLAVAQATGSAQPVVAQTTATQTAPAASGNGAQPSSAATETETPAAGQAVAAQASTGAIAPSPDDDTVRVTYVPEIVKAQLRDEIKTEVLAQARQEHWAAPNALPAWVSRFTPFGDIRIRYEGDNYPSGNDNTGSFPNFNAINTGAPFDTSQANNNFPPELNVDQNRTRVRLRARMGTAIDLGEGFTSGFRIATGENDSPVTENQTLGAANSAQGGDFSKYAIWLDRAFIKYEVGGLPDKDLAITIGRFDNPFFDPSTLIWADGIGFDGAAVQGKYPINDDITPFIAFGAFPVFDTDLNFATNSPNKYVSEDKWLYAAQLGTDWEVTQDINVKVGAAYYFFHNIEGKLSDSFIPLSSADIGDTDDTRPSFAQNGNTYMPLRNINNSTSLNNFGTEFQYQYYGLATRFHELAFNGKMDYNHFEPFQVSFWGEYENNLVFNKQEIAAVAVNNLGSAGTGKPPFVGGDTAWIAGLTVGKVTLAKRWDWNVSLNYRHVESDSVVDGFDDADFGGVATGTNLKGYTLGGTLALASHVWLGLRWMSSSEVSGPVLKTDIIQMDLNSKF
jgi:hypothetical protein